MLHARPRPPLPMNRESPPYQGGESDVCPHQHGILTVWRAFQSPQAIKARLFLFPTWLGMIDRRWMDESIPSPKRSKKVRLSRRARIFFTPIQPSFGSPLPPSRRGKNWGRHVAVRFKKHPHLADLWGEPLPPPEADLRPQKGEDALFRSVGYESLSSRYSTSRA